MLIIQPLLRYADFEGRSRRAEYWQFAGAVVALLVAFAAGGLWAERARADALVVVLTLSFAVSVLSLAVPALALRVRRLHDMNRTGWWVLVAVVPLAGTLALAISALFDGTPGPNRFGPDPKGRGELGAAAAGA